MGLKENFGISKRPFEVIFLIDTSFSMKDNKIQSVNSAISGLEKELKDMPVKNPTVQCKIRIITFGGDHAKWHTGNENDGCPIENFNYSPIPDSSCSGGTPMGDAIGLLCKIFEHPNFSDRSLNPWIIVFSDGKPTDNKALKSNLTRFLANPWGRKAEKAAVAIGDADRELLVKFTGDKKRVKSAANATDIVVYTQVLSSTIAVNPGGPIPIDPPETIIR